MLLLSELSMLHRALLWNHSCTPSKIPPSLYPCKCNTTLILVKSEEIPQISSLRQLPEDLNSAHFK